MSIMDDLRAEVKDTVENVWGTRDGRVVPELDHLALDNDRVELDAVFLYADLADSTELAIADKEIASEVCKSYIRGVTRLIHENYGEVRSFDGDRVMGVFIEDGKETDAVRCGLQINTFFRDVLVPEFAQFYWNRQLSLNQTVGIDLSEVYVCRAGPRVDNDLIWVGRAPNVAAKLSSVRNGYNTLITSAVYGSLLPQVLYDGTRGNNVWNTVTVAGMSGYGVAYVCGSTAYWDYAQ